MRVKTVLTVFRKEVKDAVRDKRSLFISVIFPVILFPMIFSVLDKNIQSVNSRVSEEIKLGFTGNGETVIEKFLEQQKGIILVKGKGLEEKLKTGEIYALIGAENRGDRFLVNIAYDNSRQSSVTVFNALAAMLDSLSQTHKKDGKQEENTYITVRGNTVYEKSRGDSMLIFSTLLPFLLFVFAALSPVALAADTGAGEKERNTIEPLLSNPVSRADILAGKFLSLILTGFTGTIAFASGIVLSTVITPGVFGFDNMAISVSPVSALLLFLVSVILIMFFSSAELSLSLFAKSPKEAQVLFLPLLMCCMSVGYGTSVIDPRNITSFYRHIPLVNLSILIKELSLNIISPSVITVTFLLGIIYITLFLILSAYLLSKESILYRN